MEKINKDLTAALVDNELQDEALKNKLIEQMESDADLKYDYMVQRLVKNLIHEKIRFQETPDKVRKKVLRKIQPKELRSKSELSMFSGFLSRPAFSLATATIIVIAVILILMNRPGIVEPADFALEQLGEDNMFVQANNNFRSIVEGRIVPQLVSSNPEEIKNFFKSSGVKYQTLIPEQSKWGILGAVVSEDKGEKFAHHVYSNDDGELVYLFQVEQTYLQTHEILSLTEDFLSYLEQGKCYTTIKDNITTLMAKSDNIIYAVVSNASVDDISQSFCSL